MCDRQESFFCKKNIFGRQIYNCCKAFFWVEKAFFLSPYRHGREQ